MADPISLALIGAGLSGTLTVGTLTVSYASIAAYALIGGGIVGGSLLINALSPKQHVDEQVTVKQATPPRKRAYGRVCIGGAYYFFYADGVLVSGFILCEGPIASIEEHWFNGVIATPEGGSNVLVGTAHCFPWDDNLAFISQLGTVDQVMNPALAGFNFWDANHRNRGLANTVMRCYLPNNPSKNFSKTYPSGVPSYLAVCRAALIFDPRDPHQSAADPSTWAWSQNPALIAMDYLTHPDGMAIPRGRINLASFTAMAELCDQAVAVGVLGATDDAITYNSAANPGAIETRYVCWGTYTLDEAPKDVLERILKSCDGELYPIADGTIGLRGGQWDPPTVTITPDMIVSLEATRGVDKMAAFNQLRIKNVSPINQYQIVEGDPWDDVAGQQAAGEVLPKDFELAMVPSYTQAQRLAKIAMAKGNPAWLLKIRANLAALQALGERTVHVTYPDLGIDDDMFVNAFTIVDEATCEVDVGSLAATAYEWSVAEERNGAPAALILSAPAGTSQTVEPAGLALTVARTNLQGSTSMAASLAVSVDAPADQSLELVAQYQKQGDTTWLDMTTDQTAYTAVSGYVNDGATYDVRVAFETYGGTIGPYATASIVVEANATAPTPPTNLGADINPDGVTVDLGWINSNDPTFSAVRLYRGASGDIAEAAVIATIYGAPSAAAETMDAPGTGTWNYWIDALNSSGAASAAVGPVTATLS